MIEWFEKNVVSVTTRKTETMVISIPKDSVLQNYFQVMSVVPVSLPFIFVFAGVAGVSYGLYARKKLNEAYEAYFKLPDYWDGLSLKGASHPSSISVSDSDTDEEE